MNTMKAVIATTRGPAAPKFQEFVDAVRSFAKECGVAVIGYTIQPGPGCCNHGIMLTSCGGLGLAKAMDSITMALMPARWSEVPGDDPAVEHGVFEYRLNN